MTTSIVGPVLVYFDRFLIGSILTIAAVAYYTAPYEVAIRLSIIPASLTLTLFPAFSSLEGAGNNNRVTHLLARSIKYPLLSLGPIAIVLGAFAPEILRIWLGYDFAIQSATVLQILVIGVLFNSVAQIPYALLQGVGRPDITAKIHLLQLPIYVAVVWFSVRHWGLAGAGVAWTFRVVLDAFLMFLFAFRICNLPFRSILSRDLVRTSLSLIFLAFMVYAIKNLDGYFPFLVQIFFFLTLFILFTRDVWKNILDDFDRGMIIGGIKIMPGLEKLV
jgi:O-antigen/teichoic acid export membrane protein